jgi:two-component system OmpR family sensor kinase/two-component system phosphate regulon sensor histidine kinase PhoR
MKTVSKYRVKLFLNFFLLFVAFAIAIGVFQYRREKAYRINELENTLIGYNKHINQCITLDSLYVKNKIGSIASFLKYFPDKDTRVTIIDKDGTVLFDSFVSEYKEMENHKNRPEIRQSEADGYGTSVRHSSTTQKDYYYLGIDYANYYVRTALPYEYISSAQLLKVDTFFLYITMLFFIVSVAFIIYFSDRFGKSISKLHQFAKNAAQGNNVLVHEDFPKNELGAIGNQIVEVYNRGQKTRIQLNAEREKLYRHLKISKEGIAIFSKEKVQLLANTNFVQYLNLLSDESAITPSRIFKIKALDPIIDFIDTTLANRDKVEYQEDTIKVLTVKKGGKYFIVQAIVFQDQSFEISINDVTKLEREKVLKQQMTSNIAHELKTPVSSILGYLETITTGNVEAEKARFFIERSYIQAQRLSALIQDISLLNKIEEAANMFHLEKIDIKETLRLIIDDLRLKVEESNATIAMDIPNNTTIVGNRPIFYSIFRNLVENALNYAGNDVNVGVKMYHSDENFYYFSVSDNGKGIEEQHLNRIFERFYRVDKGRSRSMGGTGLGLAIVKNGVVFHKGEISVKNIKGGGLEFLFSLAKKTEE